ncbi:MAG: hypothetical protein HQ402_03530 [Parcubacteria group bacterium]|nr:hypothetical protein [Parcubacteria group bacterium]
MRSSSAKATTGDLGNVDEIVQERFNLAAKQVMAQARKEAKTLGHARIRSAHILLALARCDWGFAGTILSRFDVSAERVSSSMDKFFQNEQTLGVLEPKWSTGALTVVQTALSILFRYNKHDVVGTGHLLLALLATGPENHAYKILLDLDLSREEMLEEIRRLLGPDSVEQVLGGGLVPQKIISEDDEREFREWLAFVQNGIRVERLEDPQKLSLFEAHLATRIHPNPATPEIDHATRISPELIAVLLMARDDKRVVQPERLMGFIKHFVLPS